MRQKGPTQFQSNEYPPISLDWGIFVPLIGQAHSLLARYDALLTTIPNPNILLSPLMKQEAVLSSKIEGTQATLQEVLQYEADPETPAPKYNDIKEILNYRRALIHGDESLEKKPLGLNLIKEMHAILLDGVRGQDKSRGLIRADQNWIGKDGCKIEEATYIPPPPREVMEHLSRWEKYYHFEERDKLVQLAMIHAQFELIHPFSDGNGRIGRLMVPLFLKEMGVLSTPSFYLSSYLEKTRESYYSRLLGISTDGDWAGWISYFLGAVIEQARQNIEQVNEVLDLYEKTKNEIVSLTHSQFAVRVLDVLFERPIFASSDFVSVSEIPRASALRILGCLKKGGILRAVRPGKGRRSTIYSFPKLLRIVS